MRRKAREGGLTILNKRAAMPQCASVQAAFRVRIGRGRIRPAENGGAGCLRSAILR
jgi:hypothetical protein